MEMARFRYTRFIMHYSYQYQLCSMGYNLLCSTVLYLASGGPV